MDDYLEILKQYNGLAEISALIEETQKLRGYYLSQQYNEMIRHIKAIMKKYFVESTIWNLICRQQPDNFLAAYQNANNFLKTKGFSVLLQKGYDLSQYLTKEETCIIQQMMKKK